jgi:hypothetical protein
MVRIAVFYLGIGTVPSPVHDGSLTVTAHPRPPSVTVYFGCRYGYGTAILWPYTAIWQTE